MSTHTTKPSRRRGRLWAAAVVGFLLGTIVTAARLIPWRTEGQGGVYFSLGGVDDAGKVYAPPVPRDRPLRGISIFIERYGVGRSNEFAWMRGRVQLETRTANPSGPLSGPELAQVAAFARRPEFQEWLSRYGAAGDHVSWEKVLAGQPVVWTEPQWPELRRVAAISASVGLVAGTVMYGLAAFVQFRLRKPGRCTRCGYDLAGLSATATCPECGAVP